MPSEPPTLSGADDVPCESDPDKLAEHCQLVARQTLARYGWSSVSVSELGERIAQRLGDATHAKPLGLLAQLCASEMLYHACCADVTPQCIEQGYSDLFHYLERIAAHRWPTHSSDIVQRALELTHAQIDRCRSPDSFLAFARYKLLHAAKEEFGSRAPPASLEGAAAIADLADPADVAAAVIAKVELEELVRAIERLPDLRQRAAVLGKYFLQQSDQTIAARLEVTPQHLAVLRGRALKRLRADPQLRRIVLRDDSA